MPLVDEHYRTIVTGTYATENLARYRPWGRVGLTAGDVRGREEVRVMGIDTGATYKDTETMERGVRTHRTDVAGPGTARYTLCAQKEL